MSEIWIPAAAGGGTDLDVVTAQAGDVRNGKVIVGPDGEPLTGTMKEIGAKTYTPGKSNQVIAANQFLAGAQTIAGDADLIPDNILYGKNIFGISGKVRKYVKLERDLSTSGYKNFTIWNQGGRSTNMPYLEITTGFTPLIGFFRCNSGSNPPFTYNVGLDFYQYCINYDGVNGLISRSGAGAEASTTRLIVPVATNGAYICHVVGYY